LIQLSKQCSDLPLPERIVQSLVNRLGRDPEPGGSVAVAQSSALQPSAFGWSGQTTELAPPSATKFEFKFRRGLPSAAVLQQRQTDVRLLRAVGVGPVGQGRPVQYVDPVLAVARLGRPESAGDLSIRLAGIMRAGVLWMGISKTTCNPRPFLPAAAKIRPA
jgi:hypothetical protein